MGEKEDKLLDLQICMDNLIDFAKARFEDPDITRNEKEQIRVSLQETIRRLKEAEAKVHEDGEGEYEL